MSFLRGNVSVTGGTIENVTKLAVTSTNNDATSVSLVANGGTSEKVVLSSVQGTLADAISITSTAGGVTVTAGGVSSNITLSAGNAVDVSSKKIINVVNPTSAQDAATKAYVDATAQAMKVLASCIAATTTDFTDVNYSGSGVGKTITNDGAVSGYRTIDDELGEGLPSALAPGDRVLVKNEGDTLPANTVHNGIYVVTTVGDAVSVNWVLTRASDLDQLAEATATVYVAVVNGTVNQNTSWMLTKDGVTAEDIVVDTDSQVWAQFFSIVDTTASAGVQRIANNFSLNTTYAPSWSGAHAHTAGSVTLNDSVPLRVGTGLDLVISHDGTNTSIVNTTGNLSIQNTNATGNIITKLGDAAGATAFAIKDSANADVFSVTSTGTITSSGSLVSSGPEIMSNETITLTGAGAAAAPSNPVVTKTLTIVNQAAASGAKSATLANGTTVGQVKNIVMIDGSSTGTGVASFVLTVTNLISASGVPTNNVLTFETGQGVTLVWTGAKWYQTNGGATVSA